MKQIQQHLHDHRFFWSVIALAFALRIAVVLLYYVNTKLYISDAAAYIKLAEHPLWLIYAPNSPPVSIGPVYPAFLIPFIDIIPDSAELVQLVSARLAQAGIDTITVAVVHLIAAKLFDRRIARAAMIAQALDVRSIFQVGALGTETLFIALFSIFMLAYLYATEQGSRKRYIGAGLLLGITVLTRPVPLLFPAVLAIHAWFRGENRRRTLQGVATLTAAMSVLLIIWMFRLWVNTGDIIPVTSTGLAHLWVASDEEADDLGNEAFEVEAAELTNDESVAQITQNDLLLAAVRNIVAAPGAWIKRIGTDLIRAYAQPYGTNLLTSLDGVSFSDVLRRVISGRAPISELPVYPGFGWRILMYMWHFWGLFFGIVGIAIAVRTYGWSIFPLLGWILYNSLLLPLVLVEARYLFPIMFAFNIFAAYGTVQLWDALRARMPRPLVAAGERA
jgi:4-amino-4-deoxy-L-arabinose transferase-like glycosyltransferase